MKVCLNPKFQAMRACVERIPQVFDHEGEVIFHKRNVVKRFPAPEGEWIVKRYKRPNLIQRLAYTFWRKSKARRAFLFASRLRAMGIETPEAVACIEIKEGLLFSDSFFISLPCMWPPVFDEVVGEGDHFDRPLADSLAAYFVELHRKGVLHGDLNLDNILCRHTPDGYAEFSLIDTNRTRFVHHPSRRQCLDNLMRVSHRRQLLQYIVSSYARLRGWPEESCCTRVMESLERFERRKQLKRKAKKLATT